MIPFANDLGLWTLALLPILLAAALVGRLLRMRAVERWGGPARLRALALLPLQEWDTLWASAFWVALALALVAFARPQWGEVTENIQRAGLDIVICLDTSRSMDVTDVSPSRLERARLEIRSLLAAFEGDRVGLVVFAGVPLALSPLTEDTGAIQMLLDIADADIIPAQGTDLEKGISESLRLLPQPHDRDQVILLFSDGEDQGKNSVVAARVAARLGVKVFCVGVGTSHGGPVLAPGGKPMPDPETGMTALSRLEEQTLRQVSGISDGRCWTLAGAEGVTPQILEELGRLKRREYASRSAAMRQEQFAWFLAPGLALLTACLLIPGRRRKPQILQPQTKPPGPGVGTLTPLVAALLFGAAILPLEASSPARLAQDGQAAYAAGNVEKALASYRRALQEGPSPGLKPVLHFNIGTCLLKLKRASEAKDELTMALAADTELVKIRSLFNLAQALYDEGDADKALASLRMLLSADPQNRDAKLFYEWILRNKPKEPPQPPPDNKPPPQSKPPDLLEQLPMPPPKDLQDQAKPPENAPPGMKPW